MKKIVLMLCAVMVLGAASAKSADGSTKGGTSQADGARSMWAG